MKTRVISAVILIIVAVACFVISPYTRLLILLAAAVVSIREVSNVFSKLDMRSAEWVLYCFVIGTALLGVLSVNFYISPVLYIAWAIQTTGGQEPQQPDQTSFDHLPALRSGFSTASRIS